MSLSNLSNLSASARSQSNLALVLAISVSGMLFMTTGCGSSAPNTETSVAKAKPAGNPVYEAAVKTEQETIVNSANQLHGIWWGSAALDEALLERAATGMNADQQNALIAQTQAFISTEMAVHFKPDGTVETAIEVTPPGGQPISGITTGTWSVVEARGGRFVVETTESDDAGNLSKSQKIFTLLSDNRVTLSAPVGNVLAQCNPQIILDRQLEGNANVAEVPKQTQTK